MAKSQNKLTKTKRNIQRCDNFRNFEQNFTKKLRQHWHLYLCSLYKKSLLIHANIEKRKLLCIDRKALGLQPLRSDSWITLD